MSKLILVIILLLGLALLAAGTAGGIHMSKQNDFCAACHAYHTVAWDHGLHPSVNCLDCHTKGFTQDKIQGVRKLYLMVTGQHDPHRDPSGRSHPMVISGHCQDCHMTEQARVEKPQFYNMHVAMMRRAESCLTCHSDVGHRPDIIEMRSQAR